MIIASYNSPASTSQSRYNSVRQDSVSYEVQETIGIDELVRGAIQRGVLSSSKIT